MAGGGASKNNEEQEEEEGEGGREGGAGFKRQVFVLEGLGQTEEREDKEGQKQPRWTRRDRKVPKRAVQARQHQVVQSDTPSVLVQPRPPRTCTKISFKHVQAGLKGPEPRCRAGSTWDECFTV